ncbi:DNA/RNA non-specific endonuclease [Adhaeribacter arboris]|uniref:DNA/RNA non-specific endonuclease n=1 Tax=Adhaeribacter arboris TaxID=2072846 RepID=A0A2T2YK57_9BACT|nr:DNA/RNA non-specific endonuclease [Adhaeribacter arboris]PSR55896.1 DNA/RNA non-specific endonuclease [Adhaeribacter arboris]
MRYQILFLFSFILLLTGCKQIEVVPNKNRNLISENEHLTLGNPSNATTDINHYNNYLLEKPQYVLSYSRDNSIPNWVSWHVSSTWLGSAPRQDDFRTDESLPDDWYKVSPGSYTNSGFDRGHNCPSADRTKSIEDNSATFLMTNMMPQAPDNNRNTWANLEEYTRSLVEQGQEVYVIMGNYGSGGTGSNGSARTIEDGRIKVPKQIWKVLVILPEGDDDLNRITANTRVIAIDTPNSNGVNSDWSLYRTTVDAIEKATGYDLLSSLPEDIQQILEANVDKGPTQ